MPINREPPSVEELSRQLAARVARDGRRTEMEAPAVVRESEARTITAKDPARQARSYRTCWLPADHPELFRAAGGQPAPMCLPSPPRSKMTAI